AEQIAAENGKTKMDALLCDVYCAVDLLKHTAKHAEKYLKPVKGLPGTMVVPMRKNSYIFQPKGVVGVISPWNYPFGLSMSPVISAIAAGNTVILKPSSQTTRSGMIVKEIFDNGGLPEGVLQILTGTGSLTGQALIEHADIDMLFFTGSTDVGLEVSAHAAKRLIPVILELGGKDVAIVTKNADLDRAAHGVAWGAFVNTGQTCIGTEIVLVDRAVYDAFMDKLLPIVKGLKLGKGVGELGSMTMESQRKIVLAQLEDAVRKGAKVIYSGPSVPDDKGLWCTPTLLGDVTPDMDVFREETFGPLKGIIAYDTLEEAIGLANSVKYGLSGCVYTKDMKEGNYVAEQLKVGSVNINDCLCTFAMPALPFGGVKKSGLGYYHGEIGLRAFTDIKSITENTLPMKKELQWYPVLDDTVEILEEVIHLLYSGNFFRRIQAYLKLLPKVPKIIKSIW
ncbi:MAG TPA: aldehyde dehydrogenase family protein, partial [Deltaproteobacteria bacterium]|nr:aldehyde dehydrogenase family protein [Deltaproteobacteria bacterium]